VDLLGSWRFLIDGSKSKPPSSTASSKKPDSPPPSLLLYARPVSSDVYLNGRSQGAAEAYQLSRPGVLFTARDSHLILSLDHAIALAELARFGRLSSEESGVVTLVIQFISR